MEQAECVPIRRRALFYAGAGFGLLIWAEVIRLVVRLF